MTELRTKFLLPTEPSLAYEITYNETDTTTDHLTPAINGITLLFCPFGLVGNGIMLWFLGFHIKRNPFTVYILNLAAADFGYLLCLALHTAIYKVRDYLYSLELLDLLYSLIVLVLFTYSTSLYILMAISTKRCASVLFPIWHRCRRPKHLSAIVCALLWALSCLLTGPATYICVSIYSEICNLMFIPLSVTNFLIVAPIMVVSSLTLFIKVRCSSQQRQPGKLYIVILLTILFFLLFATPFSIGIFTLHFRNVPDVIGNSFMQASINSSSNLVIYFLVGSYRNRQFRESVKNALQRVFEDKVESREDRARATSNSMATNLQESVLG
ncbi:mas-related G-protein coupled receptor member H-like [Carettochelys insculpta]|uniref:mas-related G-protein coupled receptor member H-like n=1 Tax=Carettochelys insculpta TaxID=44489 RepID=UPI003EBABAC4